MCCRNNYSSLFFSLISHLSLISSIMSNKEKIKKEIKAFSERTHQSIWQFIQISFVEKEAKDFLAVLRESLLDSQGSTSNTELQGERDHIFVANSLSLLVLWLKMKPLPFVPSTILLTLIKKRMSLLVWLGSWPWFPIFCCPCQVLREKLTNEIVSFLPRHAQFIRMIMLKNASHPSVIITTNIWANKETGQTSTRNWSILITYMITS